MYSCQVKQQLICTLKLSRDIVNEINNYVVEVDRIRKEQVDFPTICPVSWAPPFILYKNGMFRGFSRFWCFESESGSGSTDPHIFGPPGSGSISQRYGSGSFFHHAKIVRKTLIPTILWLFDFLSLKNYVNVPSKSNKQKNVFNKICFLLASWRSMMRIAGSGSGSISQSMDPRIRIHGSGSTPKCHGSATLVESWGSFLYHIP